MKLIHCLVIASSFFSGFAFSNTFTQQASGYVNQAQSYVCPMHSQIVGEQNERCPICGMKLVLKTNS